LELKLFVAEVEKLLKNELFDKDQPINPLAFCFALVPRT